VDWKQAGLSEEREYVEAYSHRIARDGTADADFYAAFNMFRFAGILQGVREAPAPGNAASENCEAVPSTLGRVAALP
jgi:aminoglycoside phosphotransferase (APT) family kinase protein